MPEAKRQFGYTALQEQPHALHFLADATATKMTSQMTEWAFTLDEDLSNLRTAVMVGFQHNEIVYEHW